MSIWTTAILVLFVVGLGLAIRGIKKRKSVALLEERELLSDDEIFNRFYASSDFEKAIVIELWNEVACALRVAGGRLRPTDRFGKEIGVFWITSEDLDALGAMALLRAKRQSTSINLGSIQTVDDYVKRLAGIYQNQRGSANPNKLKTGNN